jgi:hypothetical protein
MTKTVFPTFQTQYMLDFSSEPKSQETWNSELSPEQGEVGDDAITSNQSWAFTTFYPIR